MARASANQKDEWADRSQPIQEDMRFQRGSWTVQTAGWILLSLIMLGALLGLFSNGWLAWTAAGGPDSGLRVHYQHLYRAGSESRLGLEVTGKTAAREREILLGQDFPDALDVTGIQPEPLRSSAAPDGLHLVFALAEEGTSEIHLTIRPRRPGSVAGTIALAGEGVSLPISFFVLP